jgi:hypothetical protein
MNREIMQQALDKFEQLWEIGIDAEYKVDLMPEIRALRAELAKPEQWGDSAISDPVFLNTQRDIHGAIRQLVQPEQEPVGSVVTWLDGSLVHGWFGDPPPVGTLLYAAPPRKEWVGLTDDEVYEIANFCKDQSFSFYAKEIENKLRSKNAV